MRYFEIRKRVLKRVSFKAETEHRNNLENLSAVDLWLHTFHYLFILQKCTASGDTLAYVVHRVFIISPLYISILLLYVICRKTHM
jgi:hypothetical protein